MPLLGFHVGTAPIKVEDVPSSQQQHPAPRRSMLEMSLDEIRLNRRREMDSNRRVKREAKLAARRGMQAPPPSNRNKPAAPVAARRRRKRQSIKAAAERVFREAMRRAGYTVPKGMKMVIDFKPDPKKSARRTNLSSQTVSLRKDVVIGEGQFRTAYAGTYIGGTRNQQEAVCKAFKPQYLALEKEFFLSDFAAAEAAIKAAEQWNMICEDGKEIMITQGDVMEIDGGKYMVEPMIRFYTKFTSNSGWIAHDKGWVVQAMEAFSHFSYHNSGGRLLVCDLQGRYRYDRRGKRTRFELTDVAVCSRGREYGPTDLSEKGIESFFCNHKCNRFCRAEWTKPSNPRKWFELSQHTSMLSSAMNHVLVTANQTRFNATLEPIQED